MTISNTSGYCVVHWNPPRHTGAISGCHAHLPGGAPPVLTVDDEPLYVDLDATLVTPHTSGLLLRCYTLYSTVKGKTVTRGPVRSSGRPLTVDLCPGETAGISRSKNRAEPGTVRTSTGYTCFERESQFWRSRYRAGTFSIHAREPVSSPTSHLTCWISDAA